jgi:hypothetical protein
MYVEDEAYDHAVLQGSLRDPHVLVVDAEAHVVSQDLKSSSFFSWS